MTLNNVPKVIKLQTPWDDVDICSIFWGNRSPTG